ncbi:hypothetical protein ACEWAS_05755 [Vibrio parahaemolyticus]|nr:hypothetical protein [Vibrio parahaemolyticus]
MSIHKLIISTQIILIWIYIQVLYICQFFRFIAMFLSSHPIVFVSIITLVLYPNFINLLFFVFSAFISLMINSIVHYSYSLKNINGFMNTCQKNFQLLGKLYTIEDYIETDILRTAKEKAFLLSKVYVLRLSIPKHISSNMIITNGLYFFNGIFILITPFRPTTLTKTQNLVIFHEIGHCAGGNISSELRRISHPYPALFIVIWSILMFFLEPNLNVESYITLVMATYIYFIKKHELSESGTLLDSEILADNFSLEMIYSAHLKSTANLSTSDKDDTDRKFIQWLKGLEKESKKENNFLPPVDVKLEHQDNLSRKNSFIICIDKIKDHVIRKNPWMFELSWLPSFNWGTFFGVMISSFLIALNSNLSSLEMYEQAPIITLLVLFIITSLGIAVYLSKKTRHNTNVILTKIKKLTKKNTLGSLL